MTTPTDPPKPSRWRRQQLQMRLRAEAHDGPERRGARSDAVPTAAPSLPRSGRGGAEPSTRAKK
jgi:hypothetical protein